MLRRRKGTAGLSVSWERRGGAVIVRVFYACSGGDPRVDDTGCLPVVLLRGLGRTEKEGFGYPSSGTSSCAIVGSGGGCVPRRK